jgi:hypothetical protein
MNKEQEELVGDVYENYSIVAGMSTQVESLKKEEFINKCKTDTEFSERWGLKIEERVKSRYHERIKSLGKGLLT